MEAEEEDFVHDLGSLELGDHDANVDHTGNGMLSKLYLVGVLSTRKSFSVGVIKSQMKKAWVRKGDFTVIDKSNNIFLVGFQLEEDREDALEGSSWLVSNQYFFTPARISQLDSVFPKVIEVETSLDNILEWHGYIKFRVEKKPKKKSKGSSEKKARNSDDDVTGPPPVNVPEDPSSAIKEVTAAIHQEWIDSLATLAKEISPDALVKPTSNRTKWKELARNTQLVYNPNVDEVEMRKNVEEHGVPFVKIL
ncbi:hypothetical protein Tsubulata_008857 [Turnera subulata]|uniref:DUF4283 domain-containing protein n=1 Tax=Turnera subulata TaxID=218843 RepID=A0A9Q0J0P0_9ROSI|nr:hypothetical protein Tsubulata_008857 [Turnera subulata]